MPLKLIVLVSTLALSATACEKGPKEDSDVPATAGEPGTAAPKTTEAAEPAKASANGTAGESYGEAVTVDGTTVSIAEILADPKAFEGKQVKVEGMVTDVCPKRGCWFEMAGDKPATKMRFKVKDGVMVFPMTAKGKYAVAEGVVMTRELSLEESKEYLAYQAEEMGTEFDPASVTEPTTIVRIDGTGAVIRDKK